MFRGDWSDAFFVVLIQASGGDAAPRGLSYEYGSDGGRVGQPGARASNRARSRGRKQFRWSDVVAVSCDKTRALDWSAEKHRRTRHQRHRGSLCSAFGARLGAKWQITRFKAASKGRERCDGSAREHSLT
ncbi:hypothetical protein BHM03_00017323 [Ensete ventricosum]|uniref:Uncharacterized protein n=1 Tax=Ensete ventricosum TaxID=4639 RepID=A0A427B2K2_ENSVE|nr:hypothetical protein B296_00009741 [Ensete ventricosum]RZR89573.1 hypothetical protein BHM03_00017323 [Ensete ventricosum]